MHDDNTSVFESDAHDENPLAVVHRWVYLVGIVILALASVVCILLRM